MSTKTTVREMGPQDLHAVLELWGQTDGLTMRSVDSPDALGRFLERNPGLCFVVTSERELAGAVLCGHDGRRGYLHHLAVAESYRRSGIGRTLAARCRSALRTIGITKCHLFVRTDNPEAQRFWGNIGWMEREDCLMFSHMVSSDPNA